MTSFNPTTTNRFDPAGWHALYASPERFPSGYIFRRSAEVAAQLCADIARPGERWLDVGCGSGPLAAALAREGLRVLGIDHDPAMIAFARAQRRGEANAVSLSYLTGAAESLPVREGSIDGVVATSLTGCLPSVRGFLGETHRVLRRHGHAILTFTNRDSPLLITSDFLQRTLAKTRSSKADSFQRYHEQAVLELLSAVGYHIETTRYYNYCFPIGNRLFPPVSLARRWEHVGRISAFDRRLARNFVVVVQKRSA